MTDKERTSMINMLLAKREQAQKKIVLCCESILRLRNQCPHTTKKRHSDPSGGNDHAYTCLVCGKEW